MDGRVCLITGASGGLGLAASTGLARLGTSLRLLVRDPGKGEEARRGIVAETGNEDVRCELVDISLRRSVRACAGRLLATGEPVHALVHNAGVLPLERRETEEGLELTFATNVLGPHLLTRLLRERLIESAPARVIFVSSGGMYTHRLDVDDLHSRSGEFDGRVAYAKSKRAEVVLAERWAEDSPAPGSSCIDAPGLGRHAGHPDLDPDVQARRCDRCCALPRRERTRSSGWPPPRARGGHRSLLERSPSALDAYSARAHARDRRRAGTSLARARRTRRRCLCADMICSATTD